MAKLARLPASAWCIKLLSLVIALTSLGRSKYFSLGCAVNGLVFSSLKNIVIIGRFGSSRSELMDWRYRSPCVTLDDGLGGKSREYIGFSHHLGIIIIYVIFKLSVY